MHAICEQRRLYLAARWRRAVVRATENHSFERRYLGVHMVPRPRITGTVPNGYLTFQTLQATDPGDTNPTPTITWSTNLPLLLKLTSQQFTNKTSYYVAQATGPSFTSAQLPPPTYNISVFVTWDGVKSAAFTMFINMPYSNNAVNEGQYCSPAGSCDCNAEGVFPGEDFTGYATLNNVYTEDLFGN
jgi:hypothetical protein